MKKTVSTLLLLVGIANISAQIGVHTNIPQATLDITAKTTDGSKPEGVLAPRLTGNQIQTADAQYTTAQRGMIIYATVAATAPSAKTVNITTEGYYFFDGSVWQKMGTGAYAGSTSVALSGNSFQRAALTGDATANANSNATTVVGLQGRPVANTPPITDNILSYNGTSWVPVSLAAQNIPRQIVSVSVPGNQSFPAYATTAIMAFTIKNSDVYNAWNNDNFIVPAGMQGTYTLNMMSSHSHAAEPTSWWAMVQLEKSTDNGVSWGRMASDINSAAGGDNDNGNSLFWTGNLNVGDRLRVKIIYGGTTNNLIFQGNLAITKM